MRLDLIHLAGESHSASSRHVATGSGADGTRLGSVSWASSVRNHQIDQWPMLLPAVHITVFQVSLGVRAGNRYFDGAGGIVLEEHHLVFGQLVDLRETLPCLLYTSPSPRD